MTEESFYARLADILEVDRVTPGTVFRDLPGWCSLQGFGVLVFLENSCGVRLSLDAFAACRTCGDLFARLLPRLPDGFLPFAAGVLGVPPESLSPETAYGSIPAWDSVMHLRLVMETEARYGTRVPLERVAALRTLADFAPWTTEGTASE